MIGATLLALLFSNFALSGVYNGFLGSLAFPDSGEAASVRVGVLVGCICSGIAGHLLMRRLLVANETVPSRAD